MERSRERRRRKGGTILENGGGLAWRGRKGTQEGSVMKGEKVKKKDKKMPTRVQKSLKSIQLSNLSLISGLSLLI